MSLLVRYTLKSATDHDQQIAAMEKLVADLKAENVPGVDYSCFETEEPTEFVGTLEFDEQAGFEAFQESNAFKTYRETVQPILANPPQTQKIARIASTKD